MQHKHISLDDRPEKRMVRVIMVIFGLLCLFTSGWWSVYLLKLPDNNNNMFWLATLFLFLFGLYQIYSGLGLATRYMIFEEKVFIVRQNSLLTPKKFYSDNIKTVEIGSHDISLLFNDGRRYRIKLGLKYPDLGENIKENIIEFATGHKIEIFYKHQPL
ncbi:MAG TPA: hypothetical protein VMW76_08400 [Bacteroidales bacterium]|nr:hypothetical protein [Bacteroidales bacterium]